jgi:hypothetical protein
MNWYKTLMIISLCILASCQSKKEEPSKELDFKDKLIVTDENFDAFNERFHSDSVFQISRIDFPIEGISVSGFDKHNWTKTNWEFLKIPVSEKTNIEDYEHSLVKTDSLITERFWIENSGFEVERQFKRINGKWFLIYYNDINL